MEKQKSRKEILMEEITLLTQSIDAGRRLGKKVTKLREQLIKLILELDSLGKDEEIEKSEK